MSKLRRSSVHAFGSTKPQDSLANKGALGSPGDHANYPSHLGLALVSPFHATGDIGVLEEAIRCQRLALAAVPLGWPRQSRHLVRLVR